VLGPRAVREKANDLQEKAGKGARWG